MALGTRLIHSNFSALLGFCPHLRCLHSSPGDHGAACSLYLKGQGKKPFLSLSPLPPLLSSPFRSALGEAHPCRPSPPGSCASDYQREAQGASGKQGSEPRGYSSLAPLPPHRHVSIARCVTSMMTVPSGDTSSMAVALKGSRTQFPLLIPAAWGGKSFPLWLVYRASPFPASSPYLPVSLSAIYYSVIMGVT